MCDVLMQTDLLAGQLGQISAAWNSIWPYLLMMFGFSLIVFVHELGHFAVAKWAGVRVEKFAVGFGRELFGFTRGETRYSFNILPLGGYVKMLGQEDFDDKSNELKFKEDPRSFMCKPVGHRMAIVSAGVVMNVIFAALLFMVCFSIGFEGVDTSIGLVQPDSPADKAGLRPGDDIVAVNGMQVREFNEVQMAIILASKHEDLDFLVERNGTQAHIPVKPQQNKEKNRLQIGIAPGATREILAIGPELRDKGPDHPQLGDVIVEMNGQPVTDENINSAYGLLSANRGPVVVERKDPKNPEAPPQRVTVKMPPRLQLLQVEREEPDSNHLLGLTPLVRIENVDMGSRAELAGLESGDTILAFDDVKLPTRGQVEQSIRDNAGRDVHFEVRKADGRVLTSFVRPDEAQGGTIEAGFRRLPGDSGPRAVVDYVRAGGLADKAGLRLGDVVVECRGLKNPGVTDVQSNIQRSVGGEIALKIQREGSESPLELTVAAREAGGIDANYSLGAMDLMQVGRVAPMMHGKPTPASIAGIPSGATLLSVNGEALTSWQHLIDLLAAAGGTSAKVGYRVAGGEAITADMPIPHCLRTRLGIGPEGVISSINGDDHITTKWSHFDEQVSIGYYLGVAEAMRRNVGKTIRVEYRDNLLGELKTAEVPVTEEMVDPWLARVVLQPNVYVGQATTMVKGENLLDSVGIGIRKTHYFILQVYSMIDRMIFSRTVGVENMSGPLGIVHMGGQVAKTNLPKFLFFLGMLSANLAVINFLPLPIVDGGHMVFLIIEKIKGSPVSLKIQVATQMLGLVLIIGAFLFVTFNDAMRLFG